MRPTKVWDVFSAVFGRLLSFFFVLTLLLLLLYVLGSYQEFLDSSQEWLLRIARISLAGVVFTGVNSLVLIVIRAFAGARFRVGRFAVVLLAVILGIALLGTLTFLSTWFQGSV